MRFKLKPDQDIKAEKIKIGTIPVLVLRSSFPVDHPPGILWIHGGGYILGMKEMVYMSRAVDLVKKYGAVIVSPGYRLAWLHPYPAAVNDCYAALQYMNNHSDDLGFDKSLLMVGGESAGGGLCIAVCMMARDRGLKVTYQMPLYPMISNIDTESSRDNHGKVWNTQRNHLGWRVYLRGAAKKPASPYAAPAGQTDYSGLPPCYTFVGDGEPFYDETLAYVKNLRASGIEAEVDIYHTDMHAFDMLKPDDKISLEAAEKFNCRFEYALEHYTT